MTQCILNYGPVLATTLYRKFMMMRPKNSFVLSLPKSGQATVRSVKWNIVNRRRHVPHLSRKLYHMGMGLTCLALYALALSRAQALTLLFAVGGVWVFADVLRLRFPLVSQWGLKLFGHLMRREELKSLTGNSYYILGLIVVTLCFPKPIVLLSLISLAIGDPLAAIVGSRYGRTSITKGKSLEGMLANGLGCALASGLLGVTYFQLSFEHAIFLAVAAGTISALVELIPLPIDDNFTIPVGAAILFSALFSLVPIL